MTGKSGMSETLKVGIAGLGTVGAALVGVLFSRSALLADACGREIESRPCRRATGQRNRGVDLRSLRWFDDPVAMAKEADIDVFVELIGGDEGPPGQPSRRRCSVAFMS
jgi:homoserine dehydrogenase